MYKHEFVHLYIRNYITFHLHLRTYIRTCMYNMVQIKSNIVRAKANLCFTC